MAAEKPTKINRIEKPDGNGGTNFYESPIIESHENTAEQVNQIIDRFETGNVKGEEAFFGKYELGTQHYFLSQEEIDDILDGKEDGKDLSFGISTAVRSFAENKKIEIKEPIKVKLNNKEYEIVSLIDQGENQFNEDAKIVPIGLENMRQMSLGQFMRLKFLDYVKNIEKSG